MTTRVATYYVRKPGPESEAIIKASKWAPLIRRCALYERASILTALDLALRGASAGEPAVERLGTWHRSAAKAYQRDIVQHGAPVDVADRHFHFSYLITPSGGGPDLSTLKASLDRVNIAVDAEVPTGWGMFHVFHGDRGASFRTDPEIGEGTEEFLETNFIRDGSRVEATDLWRVSPSGIATIIRGYIEDSSGGARAGYQAGESFSPFWFIKLLGEFTLHAAIFAAEFEDSAQVLFRCEWLGLRGRALYDPQSRWTLQRVADDGRRRSSRKRTGRLCVRHLRHRAAARRLASKHLRPQHAKEPRPCPSEGGPAFSGPISNRPNFQRR